MKYAIHLNYEKQSSTGLTTMDSNISNKFHWKSLAELRDPFNDAVNYKTRQEKEFFNRIFVRTDDLFDCIKPSIYYLIGEKGSGKTAYASYLSNNEVQNNRCHLSTMTESQYKRFIALKRQGKLEYSDYSSIWRPMLLNLMAQMLVKKSKDIFSRITGKFSAVESEINSFNKDSLNPEIEVAFEMIREGNDAIAVGNDKLGKISTEAKSKSTDKLEQIKHHLLETETRLKQAISELSLNHSHVLFFDGIDYRPEHVPYNDYLACIKGLGEAAWQLNTEFFGNIRDSKGRMKIVLLVRPDVFHSLNLYNSNSRLRDNAVFLDWSTTEQAMRESHLYEAMGKYFSSQQKSDVAAQDAADQYLDADQHNNIIFRRLLRASFQKPRDVLTFVKMARTVSTKKLNRGNEVKFNQDIIRNPEFTKAYSDYLLGEVKNYAAFYMEQGDFSIYLKFFQYLDGNSDFTYDDFLKAFNLFKNWARGEEIRAHIYLRDAEALLQFFYDVNVIGYHESVGPDSNKFIHFSFRERSLTNVAPKVKTSGVLTINPGISKALDIGLRVQKNDASNSSPSRKRKRHNPRSKSPLGKKQNYGQQQLTSKSGVAVSHQKSVNPPQTEKDLAIKKRRPRRHKPFNRGRVAVQNGNEDK